MKPSKKKSDEKLKEAKSAIIKKYANKVRRILREAGISVSHKNSDEDVLHCLLCCNRVVLEEAVTKLKQIEDELFTKGIQP
jgi:hypothetical protein